MGKRVKHKQDTLQARVWDSRHLWMPPVGVLLKFAVELLISQYLR